MIGLPARSEAGEYYFRYIDRIADDDIVRVLETQLHEIPTWLRQVSEEKSRHRYAEDKWSMREVLGHVNDSERLFQARAFWFARNFDTPLPSFDQDVCVAAGNADEVSWRQHIEEFEAIRLSTILFFRHLPEVAWMRKGIASGNPFTVRALAYLTAGHVLHHVSILQERYR
jgi:hypothetical protein